MTIDQSTALALFKERVAERKFYWMGQAAYPWQKEFMNGGRQYIKRMLMAANRVGKTEVAAYEIACHATGLYPDWWEGRRFAHAPLIWVSSLTNETLRDIMQLKLLGKVNQFGTGFIPKEKLVRWDFRQAGIRNVVDTFEVEHTSGDKSVVKTKVAEQGWEKYQGTEPDVIWQDEEPTDINVMNECFQRLMTTNGILLVTFTPLKGETEMVAHFMEENKTNRHVYTATWDDAPHLDEATKKQYLDETPAYQRETRSKGVPMLGEGAVFPIDDDSITCKAFAIPDHYAQICGVDFGWDHPAAGVWLAWDRDKDIVYLTDAYKKDHQFPSFHGSAIKRRDPHGHIPVMWPHDGESEKGTGTNYKEAYEAEGVNMFIMSSRFEDAIGSTQPIEPMIQELYERMEDGRFKVFNNAGGQEFLKEKRSMYRAKGKIKALHDDIVDATRYAMMMLRYAMPKYLATRSPIPRAARPIITSSRV